MPFEFLKPLIAMPLIAMGIQATAQYMPLPFGSQLERWGPFAIIAGWLMWRETKQMRILEHYIRALDRRADKQAEVLDEIKQTLTRFEARPCALRKDV